MSYTEHALSDTRRVLHAKVESCNSKNNFDKLTSLLRRSERPFQTLHKMINKTDHMNNLLKITRQRQIKRKPMKSCSIHRGRYYFHQSKCQNVKSVLRTAHVPFRPERPVEQAQQLPCNFVCMRVKRSTPLLSVYSTRFSSQCVGMQPLLIRYPHETQ
eukprot:5167527-Amphidinium_carterae.3